MSERRKRYSTTARATYYFVHRQARLIRRKLDAIAGQQALDLAIFGARAVEMTDDGDIRQVPMNSIYMTAEEIAAEQEGQQKQ